MYQTLHTVELMVYNLWLFSVSRMALPIISCFSALERSLNLLLSEIFFGITFTPRQKYTLKLGDCP